MTESSPSEVVYLELDARPTLFAPFLYLLKLKVRIDGTLHRRRWGRSSFELSPGRHELEVSFPWFPFSEYAKSSISIELRPGEIAKLSYRMRIFAFSIAGASRLEARTVPQLPAAVVRR